MSKATVKKLHWRSKVQESFVPLGGASGELGLAIGGGADYGEFPFVTAAPGGGATVGDIILEIGGTPVLGMTLGDVRGVLNSCPHPIRIKTVSPAFLCTASLCLYFCKDSIECLLALFESSSRTSPLKGFQVRYPEYKEVLVSV
uniref:PDZ domain-containing protein n=1 Tax=Electrophorus electricus TaxID=8005 RepID=A0A4W4GDW5_ELEEL